jgi:predicted amidophosphoribosyltransferase
MENEKVDDKMVEEMKKKGYKKCPWCGRVIDRIEGCNIMACHCQKEFCFNCGEVEITSHRCIHGCPLFDYDDPAHKIKTRLRRDLTDKEREFFDRLMAEYKKKTE